MATIAADRNGNAAMAYSTSNVTSPNFPSIAYSGRLVGDAANQLPQTEVQLIAGTGPQTTTAGGAAIHRWGDYTSMSVDPADDCTFGQRTLINPQTIAGSALVTGPKVALTAGKSYSWGDQLTEAATSYWLEDIDLSGKSTWTGPISLNAKGGKAPSTEQSALLTRIDMASAQMTLGQGSTPVERKAEIASLSPAAMQLQTDLAGKPAIKLSVSREGWYRVSQRDLVNAGFSSKVAVWASTAQCDPSAQSSMNQEFFRQLFGATPLRVGEAAMKQNQPSPTPTSVAPGFCSVTRR
jgi:hypothetical protein